MSKAHKGPKPTKKIPEVNPPVTVHRDVSWLNEYGLKSVKQRAFLLAYSLIGIVTKASEASGVSCKSHYKWLHQEGAEGEVYREACEDAKKRGCDAIDAEIYERAFIGTKTAKWHAGKIVGYEWVKDTTLLIFYAKGAMPKKYRDNINLDGKIEGKLTLEQIVAAANKPPEKPAEGAA